MTGALINEAVCRSIRRELALHAASAGEFDFAQSMTPNRADNTLAPQRINTLGNLNTGSLEIVCRSITFRICREYDRARRA